MIVVFCVIVGLVCVFLIDRLYVIVPIEKGSLSYFYDFIVGTHRTSNRRIDMVRLNHQDRV